MADASVLALEVWRSQHQWLGKKSESLWAHPMWREFDGRWAFAWEVGFGLMNGVRRRYGVESPMALARSARNARCSSGLMHGSGSDVLVVRAAAMGPYSPRWARAWAKVANGPTYSWVSSMYVCRKYHCTWATSPPLDRLL